MPNYSKNIIILVRYPFSDLSNAKVRPAVIVNAPHSSQDILMESLSFLTGQRRGLTLLRQLSVVFTL
jgi:mRNA interferase MazF